MAAGKRVKIRSKVKEERNKRIKEETKNKVKEKRGEILKGNESRKKERTTYRVRKKKS